MITFCRNKNCPKCASIQETLERLCIAHKVVIVDSQSPSMPIESEPPILVDGKQVVQGNKNILTYLEKLESFKEEWDMFQSDSCYCRDDGEIE